MKCPDSNQNRTRKCNDCDYALAHAYWAQQDNKFPELMGVAGIGGCGFSEVLYRHYEEVRNFRKIVSLNNKMTVLELGAGAGRWAVSLAPLVKHYIAVDFSQQMLEVAREKAEKNHLRNITFCKAAAQDFIPNCPIDIAYLSGISQYLYDEDFRVLLNHLSPFLRPNAILIDRSTIHLRNRQHSQRTDYFCIYRTADEIENLFNDEGYLLNSQIQSYRFLNVPGIMGRLLSCRQCGNIVRFTSPLSFHLLRLLAWVSGHIWGETGELADFSHDFFIFKRTI
jgi:SAM-dependent methyltransferase